MRTSHQERNTARDCCKTRIMILLKSLLELTGRFRQEPCPALSLVNPGLDQAGAGDVVVPVADLMREAQRSRQLEVVGGKLRQHVLRSDEFVIVVLQPLMARDIADRAECGAADLAR